MNNTYEQNKLQVVLLFLLLKLPSDDIKLKNIKLIDDSIMSYLQKYIASSFSSQSKIEILKYPEEMKQKDGLGKIQSSKSGFFRGTKTSTIAASKLANIDFDWCIASQWNVGDESLWKQKNVQTDSMSMKIQNNNNNNHLFKYNQISLIIVIFQRDEILNFSIIITKIKYNYSTYINHSNFCDFLKQNFRNKKCI